MKRGTSISMSSAQAENVVDSLISGSHGPRPKTDAMKCVRSTRRGRLRPGRRLRGISGNGFAVKRGMNTRVLVGVAISAALISVAQPGAQERVSQRVTITGCLQRAEALPRRATTGTIGTTGTQQFVLSDLQPGKATTSDSTTDSANNRSTAGATPADGAWFSVKGSTDELKDLVNHRVEISGKLTTEGSVVGTSASVTDGPSGTIEVTTIKALQATCGH